MEPPEDKDGRTFVEVISEKYSPENFPYRRGPGMGVVVVSTGGPQGSPMKVNRHHNDHVYMPNCTVLLQYDWLISIVLTRS
uniref:Uncharacterized protein n=1 Tax=Neolamprologus brichardi TaxID=32507 RepID=A0A3Q4HH37_NEOBR